MTFCVSLGVGAFGLVASDSRFHNIGPLREGWSTACGNMAIVGEIYRRIRDLPASDLDAIETAVLEVGAAWRERFPENEQVRQTTLFVVYREENGPFATGGFGVDGLACRRTDALVNYGRNYPPAQADEVFQQFVTWLHEQRTPQPWETIRRIAALCVDSFRVSHGPNAAVTGHLEIGLTLSEGVLVLSKTPAQDLVTATDVELRTRFRAVPVHV